MKLGWNKLGSVDLFNLSVLLVESTTICQWQYSELLPDQCMLKSQLSFALCYSEHRWLILAAMVTLTKIIQDCPVHPCISLAEMINMKLWWLTIKQHWAKHLRTDIFSHLYKKLIFELLDRISKLFTLHIRWSIY